jgi:hypothetical protein
MAADFQLEVIKLVAAELYFLTGMTASREMYGKSYFSLGVSEKAAVDQAVWTQISGNLAAITPQVFAKQIPGQKVAGFEIPQGLLNEEQKKA